MAPLSAMFSFSTRDPLSFSILLKTQKILVIK